MADTIDSQVDWSWKTGERRHLKYKFDKSIRDDIGRLKSDNWHGLAALAVDYAIIALCIVACLKISWWLYPLAVLVIGARQRGLSTVLHDSAHGVCATNRTLNKLLGTWLTAYPIFQRHYAYRLSHVQTHHTYLGDPSKDPDLSFFIEQTVYTPATPFKYFVQIVVLPLLGSQTFAYLRYLVRNRFLHIIGGRKAVAETVPPEVRRDNISFLGFWLFVAGVSIATNTWVEVLAFWVVPYLTAFHILGWFIELSEHTPYIATSDVDLFMTRNRKSQGLEKFLTGIHNDNHHLDHHLDPRTPFWQLPQARAIRMRDETYARIDADTGGLFTRGPNGAPSAISRIIALHGRQGERLDDAGLSRAAAGRSA